VKTVNYIQKIFILYSPFLIIGGFKGARVPLYLATMGVGVLDEDLQQDLLEEEEEQS
jgi:hypothetical protein